jgi:hypothetical protein
VNLQGYCADIFHFDVPWNPARLEQRNGRVDRTLQREDVVRCHYFVYPQRAEDHVLQVLIEKVERIRRDLGTLGEVVAERLAEVLEEGIGPDTEARLDEAERVDDLKATTLRELEPSRAVQKAGEDIDLVAHILNDSRKVMDYEPGLLREAIDVGLGLGGGAPLIPTATPHTFNLPELADTWQSTLDAFRPPLERDESFHEWRKRPLRPVTFVSPEHLTDEVVQLHLQHPFVQRVLSRFRAQGWAAHDLGRVTVLRNQRDSLVRVIGIGRLSLFGPGATRLHEEMVASNPSLRRPTARPSPIWNASSPRPHSSLRSATPSSAACSRPPLRISAIFGSTFSLRVRAASMMPPRSCASELAPSPTP